MMRPESDREFLNSSRGEELLTFSIRSGIPRESSDRHDYKRPFPTKPEKVNGVRWALVCAARMIENHPGCFNRIMVTGDAALIDDYMDWRRTSEENLSVRRLGELIRQLSSSLFGIGYRLKFIDYLLPYATRRVAAMEYVYGKSFSDVDYWDVALKFREIAEGDILRFFDELQAKLAKGIP